jgi:transposase
MSRGHQYWYIVESRRVNGKPRPIVLAYLGKAEDLLQRLLGVAHAFSIRSYAHGAVAALLRLGAQLDVVPIINAHIQSRRRYWPAQPLRHGLTAGITLLLAAIGRVCMPTSKRGWWNWARTTSCEYLLRVSLARLDSQHFWDLMDCLPERAIEDIEKQVLQKVLAAYSLNPDTLLYDTTNFYTFIDSDNHHCEIAQRGRNKQKRGDLRQVGLALVVTREDFLPLFHHTYRGNLQDVTVFSQLVRGVKQRLLELGLDIQKHTLVFDRGCNSKENLACVKECGLHYVGALTPHQHQDLIRRAENGFAEIQVGDTPLQAYRERCEIWGEERTVVVFVSEKLKAGQLRGIYQHVEKKLATLKKLQHQLQNPRARKREGSLLRKQIEQQIRGQYLDGLIDVQLSETEPGRFQLNFDFQKNKLTELERRLGLRILMTDRQEWSSEEIIQAFHGQSSVELAFKNIKNPYHLAVTPEFHWTDQKIRVHYFTCILGYLLAALLWREARNKAKFQGTLDNLLDGLNEIRLTTLLEKSGQRGKPKARYELEELSADNQRLLDALSLKDIHLNRPQIDGVGVYE